MSADAERRLTDAELELMNVLWRQGPSTVREVMAALPAARERAYTTVSTIMRILQDKGFVTAQREGRAHRYGALVAQTSYQDRYVHHMVRDVFGGDALGLVRRLVATRGLADDELAELRRLVEELDE